MTTTREKAIRRRLGRWRGIHSQTIEEAYAARAGIHDEMLTAENEPRPHWRDFAEALSRMGPDDLRRRWDMGLRLLKDNGVTYNAYGDPAGLDRPWQLDPLPVILSSEEWAEIAAGIGQRATLLEAVLTDLYGPRTLIAKGLVPAALLHANPHFLRPCHGWRPAGGRRLHFYAADLVRGGDGAWRVLSDRTEIPSGAGYALENRVVVGRVLPEIARALHVQRLAPFFDALRRALQALAPRHSDDPRVVLLTPGPYSETYFEHAFLARHLGIPLVRNDDLTVRDNNVYLKALTGLQQVDVIFRQTGGLWCDPLELRGDSTLGVAGLVQAAQAGTVAIANALGTGLVDGTALSGLLPDIARSLLGEDLRLAPVPSWWCGQAEALDRVLGDLKRFVLRPAFLHRGTPIAGGTLSRKQAASVAETVRARPWEWVAQEPDATSSVPVWTGTDMEPRHMVLRVYAVAGDDGWQVMPGGLARVAPDSDLLAATLQGGGGGSKDVWVPTALPRRTEASTAVKRPPVRLVRSTWDLPSRVADNMFWLGRYMERCEITARLLRTALQHIDDALDQTDEAAARRTLRTLGPLGLSLPPDTDGLAAATLPRRLIEHHLDRNRPGLSDLIERLVRMVANLRDRLSVDTWRAMQKLRGEVALLAAADPDGDVVGRLDAVVLTIGAASGLVMENMTRGPQWLFLDSGRRLERSVGIVETLGGALADARIEDEVPLDMLLETWDSVMTYRSRYLASPRLAGVLDLLLCDESNPRSLGFQLASLARHMDDLAQAGGKTGFHKPEQRLMTILCGTVRTTDVAILAEHDSEAGFHDAERLLDFLRSRLWSLSEEITRAYFIHAQWHLPAAPMEFPA